MAKSDHPNGHKPDGRRNNKPPEHGMIKPGEVRNALGRGANRKVQKPTALDDMIWELASRIVSHDEDGPVPLFKRLLQEELLSALRDGDSAARWKIVKQLQESATRIENDRGEKLLWCREAKANMTEEFEHAEQLRRCAPDAMHPDHVEIADGGLRFRGPIERPARLAWEWLKAIIRVAACLHDIARAEHRRTGSPTARTDLKLAEKHRRWLMRRVPKGWDWKEEIYCRGSQLAFAKETVRALREIGYVPSSA